MKHLFVCGPDTLSKGFILRGLDEEYRIEFDSQPYNNVITIGSGLSDDIPMSSADGRILENHVMIYYDNEKFFLSSAYDIWIDHINIKAINRIVLPVRVLIGLGGDEEDIQFVNLIQTGQSEPIIYDYNEMGDIPLIDFKAGYKVGGRYEIIRSLSGGSNFVYEAMDTRHGMLGVPYVVKHIIPFFKSSDRLKKDFDSEVDLMLKMGLTDANVFIPGIYDVVREDFCIVMTRIPGSSLKIDKAKEKLPLNVIIQSIIDISLSLSYMHAQEDPFVHLDIKPDNLILDQNNHTWLIDFGITKRLSSVIRPSQLGTPRYMSPEQKNGFFIPASDIYSLAVTVIELIINDLIETCNLSEILDNLYVYRSNIPVDLIKLLRDCVSIDYRLRPGAEDIRMRAEKILYDFGCDEDFYSSFLRILECGDIFSLLEFVGKNHLLQTDYSNMYFLKNNILLISEILDRGMSKRQNIYINISIAEIYLKNEVYDECIDKCDETLFMDGIDGYYFEKALVLKIKGTAMGDNGNIAMAIDCLERSIAIIYENNIKSNDAERLMAQILNNIGKYHYKQNNYRLSKECYLRSLHIWERIKEYGQMSVTLSNIGMLYLRDGDRLQAESLYRIARDQCKLLSRFDMVANMIFQLASLYFDYNELGDAGILFENALRTYVSRRSIDNQVTCLYNLVDIYTRLGNLDAARDFVERLWVLVPKVNDVNAKARSLISISLYLMSINENDYSLDLIKMAAKEFYCPEMYDLAFLYEALSINYLHRGCMVRHDIFRGQAIDVAELENIPIIIESLR